MMFDALALTGAITVTLTHEDGREEVSVYRNLIVNAGRAAITNGLIGSTTAYPNYLELGTGTTTVAASDTALVTPSTATWKAIAAKTLYSTYIASFDTTYVTSQANGTFSEIGIFAGANATANSGSLFARALIAITKTSSMTLTVNWRIQVA
jgi:hypothetical protein